MSAATRNVAGSRRPDVLVGNDRCHRRQSCRKSLETSVLAVGGKETVHGIQSEQLWQYSRQTQAMLIFAQCIEILLVD